MNGNRKTWRVGFRTRINGLATTALGSDWQGTRAEVVAKAVELLTDRQARRVVLAVELMPA